MKKTKRVTDTVPVFVLFSVLLSACQANTPDGANDGFFHQYFVNPFTLAIQFLAELFNGSYGISIIVITLIIRLLLMPFMLRVIKNQQQMKQKMDVMKPELEKLQKRLKETKDPAKQREMQQEMMALYQKHGVNPLQMGCLPMLIQMPILMGFYYAIRGSKEIATHSFLWFSLGQTDIWMTVLAGVIYFIQFKVSQAGLPEAQKKQMQFIGLLSPVMIFIISLNVPAALPLYWSVSGMFLIGQTWLARKMYRQGEHVSHVTNP